MGELDQVFEDHERKVREYLNNQAGKRTIRESRMRLARSLRIQESDELVISAIYHLINPGSINPALGRRKKSLSQLDGDEPYDE